MLCFLMVRACFEFEKAKISWDIVCLPKEEGGLGFRPLKEANMVNSLKLIWRLTSQHNSLWVRWVHTYLIRQGTFWSVKENTSLGSWMWRKLLKYRESKTFHRMVDQLPFGMIHGRIWGASTTQIEVIMENQRLKFVDTEDIPLWKQKEGVYKHMFSTKRTWHLIRQAAPTVYWYAGVWFQYATPKDAFFTWLALLHNILTTGDRMVAWNLNIDPACIFCQHGIESHNHLFFECPYTAVVWTKLTRGLLQQHFTMDWDGIIHLLVSNTLECRVRFLVRYVLQTSLHSIWRERNERRHGSSTTPLHLWSDLLIVK